MNDEVKTELWFYGLAALVILIILWNRLPEWKEGNEAKSVLTTAGYSAIQLKGISWFSCPDLFGMEFEAKGPTGVPARGTVCKGILTSASIRLKGK